MADHPFAMSVEHMKQFFDRGTSCFDEKDSGFAPRPEMYTVAQHVAHTAQTVEWFIDGAFSSKGFNLDFNAHLSEVKKVTSLNAARAWMDRATKKALEVVKLKDHGGVHAAHRARAGHGRRATGGNLRSDGGSLGASPGRVGRLRTVVGESSADAIHVGRT